MKIFNYCLIILAACMLGMCIGDFYICDYRSGITKLVLGGLTLTSGIINYNNIKKHESNN